MTRKALILNVTRMGDLIQTGPLVARLHHEWSDVEVDLVVDRQFAGMARLMPGVRHVHAYDFHQLLNECRAMSKDVVSLYRDVKGWSAPLVAEQYDRVVNLTFTRRSGLLAAYLRAKDARGVICAPDGSTIVRNPWLAYFADLHRYRRFNRFNLVDLYALGGSGVGPFAPLSLTVSPEAQVWAGHFLGSDRPAEGWVAVQVGASEAIKAWRPAYFGQAMAHLGRQLPVGFVLIGTETERAVGREALAAYRQAGGVAPILDAVGRTDLTQLIALLGQCRLLLTNDTGPMHMAVAVGTRVVDLSVGHVDFRETGPYGRGHWVVQPELHCAPCGFDQVCAHHACKDRIDPQVVAALCAHALGRGELPWHVTGARLYASSIDEDGLVQYDQRAGQTDEAAEWYGRWWRRFWYADFTGGSITSPALRDAALDGEADVRVCQQVESLLPDLGRRLSDLTRVLRRRPIQAGELQDVHRALTVLQERITRLTEGSPIVGPLTVALWRDLANDDGMSMSAMAEIRRQAFLRWCHRITLVSDHIRERRAGQTAIVSRRGRGSRSMQLPMVEPPA